jgi:hypothetical protein
MTKNALYSNFDDHDSYHNHEGIYNLVSSYEPKNDIASIIIKIHEGEKIMDNLLSINY